jgi:acetylornithine deacetylase/succinyl-diaminopimelate desuccinylase-like protein
MRGLICSLTLMMVGPTLTGPVLGTDLPDFDELAAEGIQILADYIRIDTSNPPGNEIEGARFLGEILGREGIPYEILESAPGRANLIARLPGKGSGKPLILLQHIDVVPPEDHLWSVGPFAGEIRDGAVWGRGALDMKGLGVVHLMTLLALKRGGIPPDRDLILLATADEEAGSRLGMGWLADNHFDRFRDAGLVLGEGGANLVIDGRLVYVGIEITQKVPVWIRLSVRGVPGHGSLLRIDSAPVRLVRALNRVLGYQAPLRVEDAVASFFGRIARFQPQPAQRVFGDVRAALADPAFRPAQLGGYYAALLQNTVNLTVLQAGHVINAVPSSALAELDCRLLPGQNVEEFLADLTRVIDDPAIQMDRLLEFEPGESPSDSELFDAVGRAAEVWGLGAEVGPSVLPGFTDSHFFRVRGIPAYGFSPFRTAGEEARGIHGRDERISVDDFRFGLEFFYRVVADLVRTQPGE